MSRSPKAYRHTPTAYQTDLSWETHDAGTHGTVVLQMYMSRTLGFVTALLGFALYSFLPYYLESLNLYTVIAP
jgi:hypothetical protein